MYVKPVFALLCNTECANQIGASQMRIAKRTNIAVRLLMYCAANTNRLVTKGEIAKCCNVSENHLAQVINQLGQLGFLHTQRGR